MIVQIVLGLIFLMCLVYWLIQSLLMIRVVRSVKILENLQPQDLQSWPAVSVIIPARNEAATLGPALEVRLRDDYPEVEFILIDDRSIDGTAELVDVYAARDPRVKPVHIKDLPEGWLGKVHALARGAEQARGEWLLFSDVDVHVMPGTLKKAVAYAEARKLDHLAVFPDIRPVNFVLDIIMTVFIRMLCLAGKVWLVEDPASRASIGSGSFNLVRASALAKSKGFEWIRLEQGDDVALGRILKEAGGRQSLLNGRRLVQVTIYRSVAEMTSAVERPTYTALGNFSFWRLFIAGLVMLLAETSPYLALLPLGVPGLRYAAILMIGLCIGLALAANIWFRRPLWTSAFTPIASLFMVLLMWRAGFVGARRHGVYWRGTFYPNDVLKQGRRFQWR